MPLRRSDIAAYAIALLALTLLGVRAWRIDFDYSIDFQTYWLAGTRVAAGHAADLYAPGGGPADGTPVAMGAGEFKNIPIVAVAFAPLAAWDYPTAKRVVWWLGFAAVVFAGCVAGVFGIPEAAAPPSVRAAAGVAVLAAMAPTHIALRHGQTTPFIAALIAVWLAAGVRNRPVLGGAALGIACIVKFPPLALLALDAVRGRMRAVAACAGTIGVGVLLSLAVFGPGLHRAYLRGIGEQSGRVMTGHNNQSLVAVAARLAAPAAPEDWTPRPIDAPSRSLATIGGLALLGMLAWGLWRSRSAPSLPIEAAGALAFGIVAFPVGWDHYVLMLAPALAALPGRIHGALAATAVTAYALLALPTPESWIGSGGALLVSHYFVGLCLVIATAAAALARSRA